MTMTRQERLEELAFTLGGAEAMAFEQQAITDYLGDVPLPEGWTEDQDSSWGDQCYRYLDAEGNERVAAFKSGTCIWMKPAHWPAIPQAVLVRAAVQCSRLREAGTR